MTIIHLGGEITPGVENGLFNSLVGFCSNGATEITVTINSFGGCPQTAAAMFNLLRGFPLNVTTHVIGACESAAVLVFLAGDVRRISPGMNLMVHGPRRKHKGITLEIAEQLVESLRRDVEIMATVLANGLGVHQDEVTKYLSTEKRISATEAVESKFATEVANFVHIHHQV